MFEGIQGLEELTYFQLLRIFKSTIMNFCCTFELSVIIAF